MTELTASQVYGRRWRKVRASVLLRDGYRCQIAGPGCLGRADQVDHIVDWKLGGAPWDPENLRAACGRCNRAAANSRPVHPSTSRSW